MGSKTIETKNGQIIVDESVDESEIDFDSMLPEEVISSKTNHPPSRKTTVKVDEDTFVGHLKTYSVFENRKTGQKRIKIIIETT